MRTVLTGCTALLVWLGLGTTLASTLDRDADPVVLTGVLLRSLQGIPPDDVVAFRYSNTWEQIPVQIDERKLVDFATVYNEAPIGILTSTYADLGTYTGPDTDPTFDADDELTFMAKDAGARAPSGATHPAAVITSTGIEIEIEDPLNGSLGYVYVLQSDGTLSPAADADYVSYDFILTTGSGIYFDVYNLSTGPNPEDSAVATPFYRTHFSDRWIRDEVNIYSGGADGKEILDRHKNMFAPGNCGRTEDTFSGGEGAFFANIDGPVRAIRSYMGANSGPLTQREHHFYERRHDATTYLRVHAISGVVDLYDYSPDAIGMSYFNDLNTDGVPVNGVPDVVSAGPIQWEMVTGAQGTLVISHEVVTDIVPFAFTSYYSDDASPSVTQCTGDAFEYATSGAWINQGIPNTDPALGAHNILESTRVIYYDAPGASIADAEMRHSHAETPLASTTTAYDPVPGDYDGTGTVDLNDHANWPDCMAGPTVSFSNVPCGSFDFDLDTTVDLSDWARFQTSIP